MKEELKQINKCFTEIRTLENRKMKEAMKENKVFDASVINWCVVGERILNDLYFTKENTQEIQEWELNMQNHLISAWDWIEDVHIKNMIVAKILSRWAVVRDEFSQKLKEQEERHKREIELYFSKLGATDKTYLIYQDIKKDVLNILSKYKTNEN